MIVKIFYDQKILSVKSGSMLSFYIFLDTGGRG